MTLPLNTQFTNNIIVGNGKSSLPARSGISWAWNVFQNVKPPTNNGIQGDPMFVNPGSGEDTLASAAGVPSQEELARAGQRASDFG